MSEYVRWLEDIGREDRSHVGGKGARLGELLRAGFRVPPGFVVKTRAFERFLNTVERGEPVRPQVSRLEIEDAETLRVFSQAVRNRFDGTPPPEDVLGEICAAHVELCGARTDTAVAVRSSANAEDTVGASFAGLQDTYLWVHSHELVARLQSCWASLYSPEAIDYRRRHGFAEAGVAMAVVVQRMVDARTAGVMFTRSPTTGDRSVIVIESAWGLGSAVAGGEVTPDQWVVNKVTRNISFRRISDKAVQHVPGPSGGIQTVPVAQDLRNSASLNDKELQALADIGRRIERHFGRPQDIEWAIDWKRNEIFVLQCRPETVSSRDVISTGHIAKNPLAQVMTIFGGRLRSASVARTSERKEER